MIFLVVLSLLGLCLAAQRFVRCPLEKSPFLVISFVITLLYAFAYIRELRLGVDGVFLLGWGGFFLALPSLWRTRFMSCPPGFLIPLGWVVLLSALASMSYVGGVDEFAHWAKAAKWVFLNHGFIQATDTLSQKSYPLGSALFYYFFYRYDQYRESVSFVAQNILLLSPLMMLFTGYIWKEWKKVFLGYLLVVSILVLLFHLRVGLVNSLYMDAAVGIYLGSCIVYYAQSNRTAISILGLIFPLFALLQFKPNLWPLASLVILLIAMDQWKRSISPAWKIILSLIVLIMVMCVSSFSWYYHLRQENIMRVWQSGIVWQPLSEAQYAVIVHFLKQIVQPAIVSLCYWLMYWGVQRYQNNAEQKVTQRRLMWGMQWGCVLYLMSLLTLYVFFFSDYEAQRLASLHRYLEIYYIAWFLVVVSIGLNHRNAPWRLITFRLEKSLVIGACVGLIVLITLKYHIDQAKVHYQESVEFLRGSIQSIAQAAKKTTPKHSSLFTIWQDSDGFENVILAYELMPRQTNLGRTSFGSVYSSEDIWTSRITPVQLMRQFSKFDYVLLAHVDENFWRHYRSLFPLRLKPLQQYKVCKNSGFNGIVHNHGCQLVAEKAYLLKVIKHNGQAVALRDDSK